MPILHGLGQLRFLSVESDIRKDLLCVDCNVKLYQLVSTLRGMVK